MTNIIATITFVIVTNWTTVSIETPVNQNPYLAVYRPPIEHQVGTVCTNTVATIEFEGQDHKVVLKSAPSVDAPKLERQIPIGAAISPSAELVPKSCPSVPQRSNQNLKHQSAGGCVPACPISSRQLVVSSP